MKRDYYFAMQNKHIRSTTADCYSVWMADLPARCLHNVQGALLP